ncbi:MAG: glycosyltransferase family 4 protein [Candidatus Hydrothermarchaeaceae archaeon]
MKILHVSHNYYPVIGGAETQIKNISEGLAKRGHQVTVLTSNATSAEAYVDSRIGTLQPGAEIINGVLVKRLPILQLPIPIRMLLGGIMITFWRKSFPLNGLIRILWNGPYIKGLYRQIMESDAGVLTAIPFPFLHIYRAFSAARRKRNPMAVIPCVHPMDPFAFENPCHYRLLRECQAVLPNTDYEKDYLISMGVPEERIHVVGDGIAPEAFNKAMRGEFRKRHSIGDEEKVVLFVGRKAEGKGLEALLSAMGRVWESGERARLVLAGSTTEFFKGGIEPEIAHFPERMRRNIININDFEESEKDSIYTDCDIFVLPSKIESFGIVFLEAWICGKPVIGCRTGPVASVITEDQDGLLVRYGDVEELSAAIVRLLRDANLRTKLGNKGREKVLKRYTWDRIVSKIEAIYQKLIAERAQ